MISSKVDLFLQHTYYSVCVFDSEYLLSSKIFSHFVILLVNILPLRYFGFDRYLVMDRYFAFVFLPVQYLAFDILPGRYFAFRYFFASIFYFRYSAIPMYPFSILLYFNILFSIFFTFSSIILYFRYVSFDI